MTDFNDKKRKWKDFLLNFLVLDLGPRALHTLANTSLLAYTLRLWRTKAFKSTLS